MDIQAALRTQYHAALAMLRQAIDDCPDDLWADDTHPSYWQVVYHTLFFTHLYLMPDVDAFEPWARHRDHVEGLDPEPWPPGVEPPEPYTKTALVEYLNDCETRVDEAVPTLDLSAPRSGFTWYDPLPKLDHQINNIRHIQHHVAILSERLRVANGRGVGWRGLVT